MLLMKTRQATKWTTILLPTLAFLITVWLAARAGLKLVPMILMGYGVWAIGASLLYLLRNILGVK